MVMALATWSVIVGPSLMAFWYSSEQIFSVKPKKVKKVSNLAVLYYYTASESQSRLAIYYI